VIKYYKLIIKNFDQVKKHNFDQVNFGQVIIFQGKDCNLILQLKNILQSNFTIKKQIAIYLLIALENQTQIYLEFI